MIYEVQARLLFDKEDEARDFYHDCEVALPKTNLINPGTDIAERSAIVLIANHHDQDPNEECSVIESAEGV